MYVCISCFVFVVLRMSFGCSATLSARLRHKAQSPCDETEPYFREQPSAEFLTFKWFQLLIRLSYKIIG